MFLLVIASFFLSPGSAPLLCCGESDSFVFVFAVVIVVVVAVFVVSVVAVAAVLLVAMVVF